MTSAVPRTSQKCVGWCSQWASVPGAASSTIKPGDRQGEQQRRSAPATSVTRGGGGESREGRSRVRPPRRRRARDGRALLDVSGVHGLAGAALVAGVPASAIAALQALGEALTGRDAVGFARLLAAALVLLVDRRRDPRSLTAAEAPPFAAALALACALLVALLALLAAPALLRRAVSAA